MTTSMDTPLPSAPAGAPRTTTAWRANGLRLGQTGARGALASRQWLSERLSSRLPPPFGGNDRRVVAEVARARADQHPPLERAAVPTERLRYEVGIESV